MDHLLIYQIRPDNRVQAPALWSFESSVGGFNNSKLKLMNFTENPLAFTSWAPFGYDWKLVDLPTTETDASDNFPPMQCGRIDFDVKIKGLEGVRKNSLGLSEIYMQC